MMWTPRDESAMEHRERREYRIQCGLEPPICTRCDELDCYRGACYCEACRSPSRRCILCKGCRKCSNGSCICEKLAEERVQWEAAKRKRVEELNRKAALQKKKEDDAKQKADRKRDRAVMKTSAYVELKATLDAIKEECAVAKERLDAAKEELNAVEEELRRRKKRACIDADNQKRCVTCGELRASTSFKNRDYELSKCSSCRGKEYRARKKARATK